MTFSSRGTFSGLAEPAQSANKCGTPSLGSRMRSRPPGIDFTERPVEISDDFDFDDFKDSEECPNLGLKEEPELCSISCALVATVWRGDISNRCLVCLSAWSSCYIIALYVS